METKKKILSMGVPLLSVVLAFLVGAIIISALGASPKDALVYLFQGAFGSTTNIGNTLVKATPLIFTGLCACFAYRCGVFNLGGEGQFIMGSVAAIWVATSWGFEGKGAAIAALLVGLLAGGIWGAIPGLLKVLRGLNEMIVSIMLNYVATLFMGYIYTLVLREGSVPQTLPVPDATKLTRIIPGMRATTGLVMALVLALAIYYFLFYTSKGFQLRAVGLNPTASRFNGFPINKFILASFVVSGAIAGLGGAAELLGTQFRLMSGYGLGFGFDGVAIALIAQRNPIATVLVAYFFAVLRVGATTMQVGAGVPTSVIEIIQALVIVFAVAGTALVRLPEIQQLLLSRAANKEEK
ncbi:MAG: ABC transporter permease [Clostridia bacterium]|nr:ABC transporter permease [Candidatus Pelethousia sp.]NCB31356.1 ABC transporter permease [Clostridia bacterium]